MNRRQLLGGAPAFALTTLAAGSRAAPSPTGAGLPPTDQGRIAELVDANHILVDQDILDGFGHVSFRSARNPKHYFMCAQSPAFVAAEHAVEFDENSLVIDAHGREGDIKGERFIHGEIYRARADVNAVVHSHTAAVLPFSLTKQPLRAAIHTAYFLGTEPTPVYDIRDSMGPDNGMLVNNAKSGSALAGTLGARSVALMRGHGMVVAAPSIRDAVYRAIYTAQNAEVEERALRLGEPVFMNSFEAGRSETVSKQWDLWVAHYKRAER